MIDTNRKNYEIKQQTVISYVDAVFDTGYEMLHDCINSYKSIIQVKYILSGVAKQLQYDSLGSTIYNYCEMKRWPSIILSKRHTLEEIYIESNYQHFAFIHLCLSPKQQHTLTKMFS